jgi:phage gp46-like protein
MRISLILVCTLLSALTLSGCGMKGDKGTRATGVTPAQLDLPDRLGHKGWLVRREKTAETVSPRLHNFASFAEQPMEES